VLEERTDLAAEPSFGSLGRVLRFSAVGLLNTSIDMVVFLGLVWGLGVPVSRREGIFQPYEQVDGSISRRFGGTGLGLAICAELAERMHGRIGVLSEEGAGSLFWVELPLAVAAEQSPLPAVSLVG